MLQKDLKKTLTSGSGNDGDDGVWKGVVADGEGSAEEDFGPFRFVR